MHSLLQAVGASERVFQLLDRSPGMAAGGLARPTGAAKGGDLVLKDVWCAPIKHVKPS